MRGQGRRKEYMLEKRCCVMREKGKVVRGGSNGANEQR